MVLHWATVLLVAAMFAIGWWMVDLPRGPDRHFWFQLHKSIGLTVLWLTVLRAWYRWRHPPPPLPAALPAWRARAVRYVHAALYVLLVVQPLSGYLSSSFSGYQTRYFGIALPHWGWKDPPLNQLFTDLHVLSSLALVTLIAMHVTGALSHHRDHRDDVLGRMLPGWERRWRGGAGRR